MRLAQSTAATRPISDGARVGVVVLHVMSDRTVVDDVVQRDHAGVRGAQPALLLVSRHPGFDRRDHVIVSRRPIERRRRSVEQVVQKRRRIARLNRDRHVANRLVRPGDEIARQRALATGVPDALIRRQIVLRVGCASSRRCWTSGQPPAAICRARSSQARQRFVELRSRISQQARARTVAPVASRQQEIEQVGAARRQSPCAACTGLEPRPKFVDGGARRIRGDAQVAGECAVDALDGDPPAGCRRRAGCWRHDTRADT